MEILEKEYEKELHSLFIKFGEAYKLGSKQKCVEISEEIEVYILEFHATLEYCENVEEIEGGVYLNEMKKKRIIE